MSSVRHPTESVKEVLGDDTEIHRLSGGDIDHAIETSGEQSIVTIATDDARAIIAVDDPVSLLPTRSKPRTTGNVGSIGCLPRPSGV